MVLILKGLQECRVFFFAKHPRSRLSKIVLGKNKLVVLHLWWSLLAILEVEKSYSTLRDFNCLFI